MSKELVLYFFPVRNGGREFYACHRTCSVFFLLAGENSMRDLAGVLSFHILTFLKKKREGHTGALGLPMGVKKVIRIV